MYDHLNDTKHHTTISFQEQGNKTLLTMTMTFETTAGREQRVKTFKAEFGLIQNVSRLEAYPAINGINSSPSK